MKEFEAHELANIFPMMSDAELQTIVDDMIENGYDESQPIVLYEGKILDGRNRNKAAKLAGVTPVFVDFKGKDALRFVIRHNLNRRHLNESQRAVIAARLANMKLGDNQHTASANLQTHNKTSQAEAAELLNVSPRIVATIKEVERKAPELIKIIEEGKMSANKAAKEARQKEITAKRAEIAKAGASVKPYERWNVWQADIQTWQAPRQYDFIITDPPYPKEYLYLYEVLARRAAEWLKPGGLLIAMTGQSYLDQIYAAMSKHLDYYWTAAYLTPGQPTPLRQVNVNTTWKPLLIYGVKGEKYKGKIFGDVFKSDGNDKDFHKWGQSESGMFDIISKICLPGQYILDPFCGAGTTGKAALKFGCFFDGIDIDEENVNISKARLAE